MAEMSDKKTRSDEIGSPLKFVQDGLHSCEKLALDELAFVAKQGTAADKAVAAESASATRTKCEERVMNLALYSQEILLETEKMKIRNLLANKEKAEPEK